MMLKEGSGCDPFLGLCRDFIGKSRMRWVGHVAYMTEMRNGCRILE
jgi:hypothetical protein